MHKIGQVVDMLAMLQQILLPTAIIIVVLTINYLYNSNSFIIVHKLKH